MKKLSLLIISAMASLILLTSSCEKNEENKAELPTISTVAVTEITGTTATSGGNVTNDNGGEVTSKGIVWSTLQNPAIEQNTGFTDEGAGAGHFQSVLTGLSPNTNYYVKAYATNSAGTAYGSQEQFETELAGIGSTVTDIDGNVYNTVIIGDQCWMKENLKTTKYRNGTPIEYPGTDNNAWENNTTGAYASYNNDISYKDIYGALYNWHAVDNANGLCPSGWHVPSDDEWKILEGTVDSQYGVGHEEWNGTGKRGHDVGRKLKATSGWINGNGTDDYGFWALAGGYRNNIGNFYYHSGNEFWWGATEYSDWAGAAWYHFLYYGTDEAYRDYGYKENGFSVRCLKD